MSNTKTSLNEVMQQERQAPTLVGRDLILAAIFETLLRVEKPNVVLTGNPGVGKTAIAKYIKHLIDEELSPPGLHSYSMSFLNLNDLLAGPGYRGSFEQRCKDEFNKYIGTDTILFIDEFHAAENLGAMNEGKAPGFGNFLKPIVTAGNIRIIASTTNKEYDEMTDEALKRRFRRINVPEPGEEICKKIIRRKISLFNVDEIDIEDQPGLVDFIYHLSNKIEGFNPDKVVDIADILFAKARLTNVDDLTITTQKHFLEQIKQQKTNLPSYETTD